MKRILFVVFFSLHLLHGEVCFFYFYAKSPSFNSISFSLVCDSSVRQKEKKMVDKFQWNNKYLKVIRSDRNWWQAVWNFDPTSLVVLQIPERQHCVSSIFFLLLFHCFVHKRWEIRKSKSMHSTQTISIFRILHSVHYSSRILYPHFMQNVWNKMDINERMKTFPITTNQK